MRTDEVKWRILETNGESITMSFKCVLCSRWIITKINKEQWENELKGYFVGVRRS